MDITHIDYLWKQLTLEIPTQPPDAVRVLIRQPQGYRQEVENPLLDVADGVARVTVRYPLLDDGRYDPPPGVSKHWLMGSYEIEVNLLRGTSVVATETLTLDPNEFFPLTYDRPYAEVVPGRFTAPSAGVRAPATSLSR